MTARSLARHGRRLGVVLAALPKGVDAIKLSGRVHVRVSPGDTLRAVEARVIRVRAYYAGRC